MGTEWRNEHGGRKRKRISEQQSIGFEKCALSMTNYENPCCFEEGVIFEYTSLVNFVEMYKVNPVSGREVNMKDILRLNMKSRWDVALSSYLQSFYRQVSCSCHQKIREC